MPELPEVETVRRQVEDVVTDRIITGVTLGAFGGVVESAVPDREFVPEVVGRRILGADRRGKYLLFPLDSGRTLIVHLRMTGRLLLVPSGVAPIRFEHAAIHLDSGMDLRFGDQRKFGRLTIVDEIGRLALEERLGPEPWSARLTARSLDAALARRPGPIKGALLDQRLIAGLGNIYVDEALYRTRIHPLQPANTIDLASLGRLLRAIRHVLRTAIERQGTTFSTFENPYGEAGTNAAFLRAYGKATDGATCGRCGSSFVRIVVAGRGTSFCPTCQRLRPEAPNLDGQAT